MKYIYIMLVFTLTGCVTTKEVIQPHCPVSITSPVPEEPKPDNNAEMNEAATLWFLSEYQPLFKNMQSRLQQAQEWCKK